MKDMLVHWENLMEGAAEVYSKLAFYQGHLGGEQTVSK